MFHSDVHREAAELESTCCPIHRTMYHRSEEVWNTIERTAEASTIDFIEAKTHDQYI